MGGWYTKADGDAERFMSRWHSTQLEASGGRQENREGVVEDNTQPRKKWKERNRAVVSGGKGARRKRERTGTREEAPDWSAGLGSRARSETCGPLSRLQPNCAPYSCPVMRRP